MLLDYAFIGGGLALGFLIGNPLVFVVLAVAATVSVFVLYQRHEWHVWDKIRGKTQIPPYVPQSAPTSQQPQYIKTEPEVKPVVEEKKAA